MHIACWIPKATKTHSEHVILITFPLQKWLHESVSVSRYTYIVCLANSAGKVIAFKMTFDFDFKTYAPCLQLLEFQMSPRVAQSSTEPVRLCKGKKTRGRSEGKAPLVLNLDTR